MIAMRSAIDDASRRWLRCMIVLAMAHGMTSVTVAQEFDQTLTAPMTPTTTTGGTAGSVFPRGGGTTYFVGIDGSKQPQDYGVNANLGLRLSAEYSGPLWDAAGVGFQIGSAVEWSDNAVRVYELIGQVTERFQNHTTAGVFARGTSSGSTLSDRLGWALAVDHLYQDGYDSVSLFQLRGRLQSEATSRDSIGVTGRFELDDATARFGGENVTLRSINQYDLFWRHYFATGVQTTASVGVAERHGEHNAVTGPSPSFDEAFVVGADFLAPVSTSVAIYGETNLIFPADTGTVDAFLGMAWFPGRRASMVRRGRYDAMQPLASDTTFPVDLIHP